MKSKPHTIRFEEKDYDFICKREGFKTAQSIVTFLLSNYLKLYRVEKKSVFDVKDEPEENNITYDSHAKLDVPQLSLVDHRDHNPLNNQRNNLRACNSEQNSHNTSSRTGSTSKYLGVSVHTTKIKGVLNDGTIKIYTSTRYLAQIQYKKSKIKIGRFKTENEAAIAYNEAATKYFGEFANLNVIDINNGNSFEGRKKLPFRLVTPKMLEAEKYVDEFIEKFKVPPTYRDVSKDLGLVSSNSSFMRLRRYREKMKHR